MGPHLLPFLWPPTSHLYKMLGRVKNPPRHDLLPPTTNLLFFLFEKRNENGSFVETWMDLEPVIQGEVSQKEKNKYRINTYMWNLEKWYR